jgi:hypothetical protein
VTCRLELFRDLYWPHANNPATVSASALALHLDCSWTYIGKLEAEGVVRRQVTASRSTRAALPTCDACGASGSNRHALRLMRSMPRRRRHCREEKQRKLVRQDDVNELIDQIAGITLTHLSGMAARCSRDMVVRRNIDAVVMQIRREIAEACSKAADEQGEPPLDQQD